MVPLLRSVLSIPRRDNKSSCFVCSFLLISLRGPPLAVATHSVVGTTPALALLATSEPSWRLLRLCPVTCSPGRMGRSSPLHWTLCSLLARLYFSAPTLFAPGPNTVAALPWPPRPQPFASVVGLHRSLAYACLQSLAFSSISFVTVVCPLLADPCCSVAAGQPMPHAVSIPFSLSST